MLLSLSFKKDSSDQNLKALGPLKNDVILCKYCKPITVNPVAMLLKTKCLKQKLPSNNWLEFVTRHMSLKKIEYMYTHAN